MGVRIFSGAPIFREQNLAAHGGLAALGGLSRDRAHVLVVGGKWLVPATGLAGGSFGRSKLRAISVGSTALEVGYLDALSAHRRIKPFEGSVSSSSFFAVAIPAIGSPFGSSAPICTSTDAWSQ